MDDFKTGLVGFLIVVVVILLLVCNPVAMVGVGERGVKVTLGQVSPHSYTEGIHVVTPFVSKIHTMNVKTQKMHPATTVFTKDIQQARIEYVVNYNLQPENVHKVYREVGKNYQDIIIVPTVEGVLKNIIGTWNASDLISNRTKATNDILKQLQEQLADNYINVTDFQIVDIDYSDAFEKAVELNPNSERMRNNLEQARKAVGSKKQVDERR